MKKILSVLLFVLISSAVFGQIEFTAEPINASGISNSSSSFRFQAIRNSLPLIPPNSKQRPRFQYYWNFRDGDFYLTEKYLGTVEHTFKSINTPFNVKLETTGIKTGPEEVCKIAMPVTPNNLFPKRENKPTWKMKKKGVELLNVRQAVPDQLMTIVAGYKNPCDIPIDTCTITIHYKNHELNKVDDDVLEEVYYGDTLTSVDTIDTDRVLFFEVFNLRPNEQQRHLFLNSRIDDNIKIGKVIEVFTEMETPCGIFKDTLFLRTGNSHDPNWKEMECITDIEHFNTLDSTFQAMDSTCLPLDSIFTPLDSIVGYFDSTSSLFESLTNTCIDDSLHIADTSFSLLEHTLNLMYVLIHFQNDGTASTDSILINDSLHFPLVNAYWCPQQTLVHQTEADAFIVDTLNKAQFDFDTIQLRGTNEEGYLTEFTYEETLDELEFVALTLVPKDRCLICNEADIYFDDNAPETVRVCKWILNPSCNNLQQIYGSILPRDTCIERGDSIIINSITTDIGYIPTKYQWAHTNNGSTSITVKPTNTTTYTLGVSQCNNGIEQYTIDNITIEVKDSCDIDSSMVQIMKQDIACYDGSTGMIQINVMGGNPPFIFEWDDIIDNTPIRNNLTAGLYIVKVTDADQCSRTDSIVIEEPLALHLDYEIEDHGGGTCSIFTFVSGGTTDYQYQWSNNTTTANLYNISWGVYTLTLTDANGCTLTEDMVIGAKVPTLSQWGLLILMMLLWTVVANDITVKNVYTRTVKLPFFGRYAFDKIIFQRAFRKLWFLPLPLLILIFLIFQEILWIDLIGVLMVSLISIYCLHLTLLSPVVEQR